MMSWWCHDDVIVISRVRSRKSRVCPSMVSIGKWNRNITLRLLSEISMRIKIHMALRWCFRGLHRRIRGVRFGFGKTLPFFCPILFRCRRKLCRSLFRPFFVRGWGVSSFPFPCFWWFFRWKRRMWWVKWGGRQVSYFWTLSDKGCERGGVVVRVILV